MNFKTSIESLRLKKLQKKFPQHDIEWIHRIWGKPAIQYTPGKSAPRVEKNIVEYLNLLGFQAEKRAVMGRQITTKDTHTPMGTIKGKTIYIPTTGTKGSADISAIVYGIAVMIEVKVGKDRQSDHQKRYEQAVDRANGFYMIARSEDDFLEKFNELLNHPKVVLMREYEKNN